MRILKKKDGFGLAEIIISMVLLTIISVVGSEYVVLTRPMLKIIKDKDTAVNLVISQIEDLKAKAADNYDVAGGILAEERDAGGSLIAKPSTLNAADIPAGFNLTYTVENRNEWEGGTDPEYKIITARCTYGVLLPQVLLRAYITRTD